MKRFGSPILFSLCLSALCFSFNASAQTATDAKASKPVEKPKEQVADKPVEKPKAKKVSRVKSGMKITYGSAAWNRSSTRIDTAFLFLRDKETGRLVKILLEETEPDSSVFAGRFSIAWASDKIKPEVFIPPRNMRGTEDDLKKFNSMIASEKVPRMPLVMRKTEEGESLDVYDTKDQAQRAYAAYMEQLQLEKKLEEQSLIKPAASQSELDASKLSEREKVMVGLAKDAAQRELDRIRLEQLERQKTEELRRRQELMNAAERKNREDQAKAVADKAMKLYQEGKYPEAEDAFKESTELDPNSKSYFYSYGICLYRNEKFNEALVILNMVQDNPDIALEKKYYIGLIHFRLKEWDAAVSTFESIIATKHPVMAPSAAFYKGITRFTEEKYDEAKPAFEYVLDNSEDPRLDEKAEEFIEKITGILAWKAMAAKKFVLSSTLGYTYDSNILYSPDNNPSQGAALNKGGDRALIIASAEYRAIFKMDKEFVPKISTLYMYSSNSDFARADPWMSTFNLPYTWKGVWGTKGYKLTVGPGYEVLFLDANAEGTRTNIQNSILATIDGTLVMSDRWFANYGLDVRSEDSTLTTSTGVEDLDALKYAVRTTQTWFTDTTKKKALSANAGLTLNQAKGDNKVFYRIDAGATFLHPIAWESMMSYGLSTYILNYNKADASARRQDTNVALTLSWMKPFKEWFTWGVTGAYTKNESTLPATYQYTKYSIMTTATFNVSL